MITWFRKMQQNLMFKVILTAGVTLLIGICTWSYLSIRHYRMISIENVVNDVDRLSNTIRLGTHYAMMLDSREDIRQTINNVARQPEIENIRIYNKLGQIMFSNRNEEVGETTDVKEKACYVCHKTDPPETFLEVEERTRIYESEGGYRKMGILSPIYNEPGCSGGPCHVHPSDKEVLGLLDMVVSLDNLDHNLVDYRQKTFFIAAIVFLATSSVIFLFIVKFIRNPVKQLISGTRLIGEKEQYIQIPVHQHDEMGELARAISKMSKDISDKHTELIRQKNEYRNLFELVPCLITVQDRNYRLLSYNRMFAEKFGPVPGEHCYRAYKGLDCKCKNCPVEKTFQDGKSHVSEETGYNKDGSRAHWIVTTSPIRDSEGNVVAAMEVSLDITRRKVLEEELAKSEHKYQAIFSSIPSAVFVLEADSLEIIDCNESVREIYGHEPHELLGTSFLELFKQDHRTQAEEHIKKQSVIDRTRNLTKDGRMIFSTIRVSPMEYAGETALLVTASDITKRLETEQNLIQASKMATLGEMATGVAHEINQPLSVIKTASSFFLKKLRHDQQIDPETLTKMTLEIDNYADRATRIINHLREFGRKPEMSLEPVDLNKVIKRAFDFFSQQFKLRGIEVVIDLGENLPLIQGDQSRLEQVFINLLLNARDAIEDHYNGDPEKDGPKKITISTGREGNAVSALVKDTGAGIPHSVRERIFEPFFTTKKVGKGTGLGLSISYGIVQDCGGAIALVDAEDASTAFKLTFYKAGIEEA
jgi:histidine kinase